MHKELFTIPGTDITIYTYGLLLVIGAIAGICVARALARRKGIDPELCVNAGILALLTGVVGARISHILENWSHFTREGVGFWGLLWEAVNIRSGGLTYYGGFLLAFPSLIAYAWWKRINIRVGMDIVAPALMVGLAFGRLGCFANGCCYGEEWNGACAVQFPYYSDPYLEQVGEGKIHPPKALLQENSFGQLHLIPPDRASHDPELAQLMAQEHSLPVHATQLYSSLTAFLLAGMLLAFIPLCRTPGRVFALMLMVEPITRFLLELLRVEPPVDFITEHFHVSMSLSMALAIPQFILGVALWWWFGRIAEPHPVLQPATRGP